MFVPTPKAEMSLPIGYMKVWGYISAHKCPSFQLPYILMCGNHAHSSLCIARSSVLKYEYLQVMQQVDYQQARSHTFLFSVSQTVVYGDTMGRVVESGQGVC